jgi:hypothetical protein
VDIYVKYEGLNPTGSFKDRGMTMAVTKAVEAGSKAIICAGISHCIVLLIECFYMNDFNLFLDRIMFLNCHCRCINILGFYLVGNNSNMCIVFVLWCWGRRRRHRQCRDC